MTSKKLQANSGTLQIGGTVSFDNAPSISGSGFVTLTDAQTVGGAKTFSDNANFGGNLTLNNATPARLNFLDVNHPYIIGDRFGLSTRGGLLFKAYNGGEIDAGQFNHTGAWTLGPSTGLSGSHIIRNSGNAYTLLVQNSDTDGSAGGLRILAGGSATSDIPLQVCQYNGNVLGQVLGDGAWTLGPSSGTFVVNHEANLTSGASPGYFYLRSKGNLSTGIAAGLRVTSETGNQTMAVVQAFKHSGITNAMGVIELRGPNGVGARYLALDDTGALAVYSNINNIGTATGKTVLG